MWHKRRSQVGKKFFEIRAFPDAGEHDALLKAWVSKEKGLPTTLSGSLHLEGCTFEEKMVGHNCSRLRFIFEGAHGTCFSGAMLCQGSGFSHATNVSQLERLLPLRAASRACLVVDAHLEGKRDRGDLRRHCMYLSRREIDRIGADITGFYASHLRPLLIAEVSQRLRTALPGIPYNSR